MKATSLYILLGILTCANSAPAADYPAEPELPACDTSSYFRFQSPTRTQQP